MNTNRASRGVEQTDGDRSQASEASEKNGRIQLREIRPTPYAGSKRRPKRPWRWGYEQAMLLTLSLAIAGLVGVTELGWIGGAVKSANTFACSTDGVFVVSLATEQGCPLPVWLATGPRLPDCR